MADWQNAAIGGGIGLIQTGINARLTQDQARLNYELGEKAAENADKRTRALYADYMSPAARIKQLREAGLSPSLFAEGAGGGSMGMATGAQGTGTAGMSAPVAADISSAMVAQAQARKLNAEADELEGKNPMGAATIEEKLAAAGANKAATAYTEAKTCMQEIENYVADETKDFSISLAKHKASIAREQATTAYWEAENAGLSFQLNLQSFEADLQTRLNTPINLAADTALKKAQTKLTEVEKKAIKDYVIQGYMQGLASITNAESYADYVETYCDNLPKQLELRGEEIKLEKWKTAIQPFVELIRTVGYMAGASQLGDGGSNTTEVTQEIDKNGNVGRTTRKTTNTMKMPKRLR